jgi:3-phosphoglycerate kinase
LAEYLGFPIEKEDDCIGPDVEIESNKLEPGKILLLENLRFRIQTVHSRYTAKGILSSGKVSIITLLLR